MFLPPLSFSPLDPERDPALGTAGTYLNGRTCLRESGSREKGGLRRLSYFGRGMTIFAHKGDEGCQQVNWDVG